MSRELPHVLNGLGQPVGLPLPEWSALPLPSEEPMEGRFCRLERLDAERHAASLHAANRLDVDDRMWTYLGYGPFGSEAEYRGWLGEMSRKSDPLFFAIVNRSDGCAVGVASYLRIDPAVGSVEVGHLAFSPLLQRSPVATEAMFLMMRRAFDHGYRRYEWKCDALNAPSRAAALRLGFTFEGIFRQATVVKGRNRDTAWYSVTDREWPARRDAFERWLDPSNFDARGRQLARLAARVDPGFRRTRVSAYALIRESGRLLLCRLSSRVRGWEGRWTLPGGGVEFGEDPAAAAVREVEEETGLNVRVTSLAGIDSISRDTEGDGFHGIRIIYHAEVTGGSLRHEADGSTDCCEWHPLDGMESVPRVDLVSAALRLAGW